MSRTLYPVNVASDAVALMPGSLAPGSPLVMATGPAVSSSFVVSFVGGGQQSVDLVSPVNVPYAGADWPLTTNGMPASIWAQASIAGFTMSFSGIFRVNAAGVAIGTGSAKGAGLHGFQAVPTVGAQMSDTFDWLGPNDDAGRAATDRLTLELLIFAGALTGTVTLKLGPIPTSVSGGSLDISDFPNHAPGPSFADIFMYPSA